MLQLPETPSTSSGTSDAGAAQAHRPSTPQGLPELSTTDSVRAPGSAKLADLDGNNSDGNDGDLEEDGSGLAEDLTVRLDLGLVRDVDDDPADDEEVAPASGAPNHRRIGQTVFRNRVSVSCSALCGESWR